MDPSTNNPLRDRRRRLGLTQSQLATDAGVSRQLVVAAESGVNTPAVDAALRLAKVLGCSAEDLFPSEARGGHTTVIPARWPRARPECLVIGGCDPALRVAETMSVGIDPPGVLALHATTGTALASLEDGGVHAAVVHGPDGRLPSAPVDVIRLQLARWQVGLGLPSQAKFASLQGCIERKLPIVQRPETAAAQQTPLRALAALDCEPPPGAVASGHAEAAHAAAMLGCAAVTTEGAARSAGLKFVPLELHTVQIWVDRRWNEHPGFRLLGDLLNGPEFATQIKRIGGYDLSGCGLIAA